jgi:nucleoid DNA-binding protein
MVALRYDACSTCIFPGLIRSEAAGITHTAAEKAISTTFDAILTSAVAGEKTIVSGLWYVRLEGVRREGRT